MLSNKQIVCPDNLLNLALKKKGIKAGIVNAGKPLPMISIQDAVNKNLIESQLALDLSFEEVKTLIINSFKSSFLEDDKKKEWIAKIN